MKKYQKINQIKVIPLYACGVGLAILTYSAQHLDLCFFR